MMAELGDSLTVQFCLYNTTKENKEHFQQREKRLTFYNTFFPSQVSIMRSDGRTGSPSFVHLTSGIGLPMKGAPSRSMSPSSAVASRRPWINEGFSSGASPRPLSADSN